jgi:hypothetical protein
MLFFIDDTAWVEVKWYRKGDSAFQKVSSIQILILPPLIGGHVCCTTHNFYLCDLEARERSGRSQQRSEQWCVFTVSFCSYVYSIPATFLYFIISHSSCAGWGQNFSVDRNIIKQILFEYVNRSPNMIEAYVQIHTPAKANGFV